MHIIKKANLPGLDTSLASAPAYECAKLSDSVEMTAKVKFQAICHPREPSRPPLRWAWFRASKGGVLRLVFPSRLEFHEYIIGCPLRNGMLAHGKCWVDCPKSLVRCRENLVSPDSFLGRMCPPFSWDRRVLAPGGFFGGVYIAIFLVRRWS